VVLVRNMKRLSGNEMTAVDSRRRSDREVRLANDAERRLREVYMRTAKSRSMSILLGLIANLIRVAKVVAKDSCEP
jgi:hypothetical protein